MSETSAMPFGSEIEIDGVLYVSVDFLMQYPEYLDAQFDGATVESPMLAEGPEEGDHSPSTHKSEMTINGVSYIAVPMLKSNPNYVELKYTLRRDVELPAFVPASQLHDAMNMAAASRRRH